MKKTLLPASVLFVLLLVSVVSIAQADTAHKRYSIAVFTPLYLDSAFDADGNYRYDKSFPKFISPGLEFYEGVKLAADSLKAANVSLNIDIYDTRSATKTLQEEINSPAVQNAGLIIGHVTPAEAKTLAAAALRKNIPFVNANLPNDAGVGSNPSLVIMNATLQTHCEGIYRFLQKNYPTSTIVYLRKKGTMEDRLRSYFTDAEKSVPGSKVMLKVVTQDETQPLRIPQLLDSTRLTVVVAASLDENFARDVAMQMAGLSKTYPSLLIGMPTWDAIDFTKKDFRGLTILYSTSFYYAKTDRTSQNISNYFKTELYSRPSDMVFRGYECVYRFGKLLHDKGTNLNSSIGEKKYKIFTDWDIQPVLNKQTLSLEYFENKKLYFIKKSDGVVKQVL